MTGEASSTFVFDKPRPNMAEIVITRCAAEQMIHDENSQPASAGEPPLDVGSEWTFTRQVQT